MQERIKPYSEQEIECIKKNSTGGLNKNQTMMHLNLLGGCTIQALCILFSVQGHSSSQCDRNFRVMKYARRRKMKLSGKDK